MRFSVSSLFPIIWIALSLILAHHEIKNRTKANNRSQKITYILCTLKHIFTHVWTILFPLLVIRVLNMLAQEVFNQWYLSQSVRLTSAGIGTLIICSLIFILIPKQNKWVRAYYIIEALVSCALWTILLIPD